VSRPEGGMHAPFLEDEDSEVCEGSRPQKSVDIELIIGFFENRVKVLGVRGSRHDHVVVGVLMGSKQCRNRIVSCQACKPRE
jgi:hypothetical protein